MNVRERRRLPKPTTAGRQKTGHLLERKKATKWSLGEGHYDLDEPQLLQGRGGVNSGLLEEAGGSPFKITPFSEATQEVWLHLSWMGSGLPGGRTVSLAAWPSFSWGPLAIDCCVSGPLLPLRPWPPCKTPGLSPAEKPRLAGRRCEPKAGPARLI